MKRLLIFLHGSAELYGSDKVLLNLASGLADDACLQPVVVLNENGPLVRSLADAGVEVHVAPVTKISRAMFGLSAPYGLIRGIWQTKRALDAIVAGRAVALVYSNTLAVLGGAFWAKSRRHAHLWHVHEIIRHPAAVRLALPRLAQWLADGVICNSEQTQSWLLSNAPSLKSRSSVIWNGLSPAADVDATSASRVRQQLGVSSTCLLVTLAGRLNHWKGQDLLIEAASLLRQDGHLQKFRFLIVGDVFAGNEDIRDLLMERIQELDLMADVQLMPFTSDMNTIWQASNIAVVPSLEPEPFGMVAIEAMSFGLPVIAAAHGGLLSIVQNRRTGLLFEPRNARALADAIWELGSDDEMRARLGQNGTLRQRQEFSLATQIESTRKLCLELAGTA